jgi:hypothetical protein
MMNSRITPRLPYNGRSTPSVTLRLRAIIGLLMAWNPMKLKNAKLL